MAGRPSRHHSLGIVHCLGLVQQPEDLLAESGAAQAWAAGTGQVTTAVGAGVVVAADPAAHGAPVAAQQARDGGRRLALLGEQDHHQATADSDHALRCSSRRWRAPAVRVKIVGPGL
jgi:hypothetical protein